MPRFFRSNLVVLATILFGLSVLIGFFLLTPQVLAVDTTGDAFGIQAAGENTKLGTNNIFTIVTRIIQVALGLLGIIAVGIVLYAGYLYMTSGGSEEKIAQAKKMLVNGVIGLIIILSSYAIASFVLNSLKDATGAGGGDTDNDPKEVIVDDNPCVPGGGFDAEQCKKTCAKFPTLWSCKEFVVESITPSTPDSTKTGMNNIVVRALFSQPLSDTTDIAKVLSVKNSQDQSLSLQSSVIESVTGRKYLVAATFTGSACVDAPEEVCITPDTYTVSVDGQTKSKDGSVLKTTSVGVSYPLNTSFVVDTTGVVDHEKPKIGDIILTSELGNGLLYVGKTYTVEATVSDRTTAALGGVAYVTVSIAEKQTGKTVLKNVYLGPRTTNGSSKDFTFTLNDIAWKSLVTPLKEYNIIVTAYDIDHNSDSKTITVTAVGEDCDEFGGGTSVQCLGGGLACDTDSQCALDYRCAKPDYALCSGATNCTCKPWPTVTNIDPLNGAAGNWVTIQGLHFEVFGTSTGIGNNIAFAIDTNADGSLDSTETEAGDWITASLAQCGEDVWHDTWIVAEVPSDTLLPLDTKSAIRVTVNGNGKTASDTTLDGHYKKINTFTKNSTVRPRLCSVKTIESAPKTASIPGAAVRATGQAFGGNQGKIFFGAVQGAVGTGKWQETQVDTTVPVIDFGSKAAVTTAVTVEAQGKKSNGVPFTINKEMNTLQPEIFSIDPPENTPGSFITIQGKNFGSSGHVYLAKTTAEAINCAQGINMSLCHEMFVPGIAGCEESWTDTQVVVEVPALTEFLQYKLILVNNTNYTTNGEALFTVVSGAANPSICSVTPKKTNAPALQVNDYISISGKNFGSDPTVFFWTKGTDPTKLSSWLITSKTIYNTNLFSQIAPPGLNTKKFTVNLDGTQIEAFAPLKNGYSEFTGPVKVRVTGKHSNQLTHQIADCSETTPSLRSEYEKYYQCCAEGVDKGRWKLKTAGACEGQVREAGYIWRFTSGLFPKVPRVAEQCDVVGWSTTEQSPSPSPSVQWPQGNNTCINAKIQVEFDYSDGSSNANIDPSTVSEETVRLYTCANNGTSPDCTGNKKQLITGYSIIKNGLSISDFSINPAPGTTWTTNTWYRVELMDTIKSTQAEVEGQQVEAAFLKKTKPCGTGTAYCFEFKTGNENNLCSLVGALIVPGSYTTNVIGPVRKPLDSIYSLVYQVKGKADQACTTVDVSNLPWQWGSTAPETAKATPLSIVTTSLATAETLASTPNIVKLTASWDDVVSDPTTPKTITGTSTLNISLGTPKVIYWEPNCLESCINTSIGVGFNQYITESTINNSTFKVYKCADSDCLVTDPTPVGGLQISVYYDLKKGSETYYTFAYAVPSVNYLKNSYYKIVLASGIKAKGYLGDTIGTGKSLSQFSWVFKTNASGNVCSVDAVDIIPVQHIADIIGEKTLYTVEPRTDANACSKYGQVLNKWQYGYNWSTMNSQVASVTTFKAPAGYAPYCSLTCLPLGSDMTSEETQNVPFCGNGVVEQGENCDISTSTPNGKPELVPTYGLDGKLMGGSCTLNCVRPGNANKSGGAPSSTDGTCGNGIIDYDKGELCDPMHPDYQKTGACTSLCLPKGSSKEPKRDNEGKIVGGYCGDGFIGADEACDPGIPGTTNCSASCLKTGTSLLQTWCDSHPIYMNTTQCKTAVSICGNGMLEGGEECEIGKNGATAENCGATSCLLKSEANICGISDLKQCDLGTEGCSSTCQLLGSSLLYGKPSLCGVLGNGVATSNAGKYLANQQTPSCELPTASGAAPQAPFQVVTAVGSTNPINTTLKDAFGNTVYGQETDIKVMVTTTPQKTGTGDYAIQCGYTEFTEKKTFDTIDTYNDCKSNTANGQGVGTNSCCYPRPVRASEYPSDGEGFSGEGVCRNTYIEVAFDEEIDEKTVSSESVVLVSGHSDPAYCETNNLEEVGGTVSVLLSDSGVYTAENGFFARLWGKVKSFFVRLFGGEVRAASVDLSSVNVWCKSRISLDPDVLHHKTAAGVVDKTRIGLYISDLLEPNTIYGVVLRGGLDGIVNAAGVGIKHSDPTKKDRNDIWIFETGNKVCKVNSVTVDPANYLFAKPNITQEFQAKIHSTNEKQIVSTPSYSWDFEWQPQTNPVFDIPASGASNTSTITSIASRNVEGHITGKANVTVTKDLDSTNNQQGKIFTGETELYASFCENPWPAHDVFPYEDKDGNNDGFVDGEFPGGIAIPGPYTNFSIEYCADAGNPGDTSDDLPYLKPAVITDAQKLGAVAIQNGTCEKTGESCTSPSSCSTIFTAASYGFVKTAPGKDGVCIYSDDPSNPVTLYPSGSPKTGTSMYYQKNPVPPEGKLVGCKVGINSECSNNPSIVAYVKALPKYVGKTDDEIKTNILCKTQAVVPQSCVGLGTKQEVLKRFLFTPVGDINNDAIGVQVFKNEQRMSAADWFKKEFPDGTTPQSVSIDGYDAVSDGKNFYVNALNLSSAAGDVYNNIYLFSINADAEEATKKVFQQMIESLQFSINVPTTGYCYHDTGGTGIGGVRTCDSNFDCIDTTTNGTSTPYCSSNKDQLQRDWQRVKDVSTIQQRVATNKVSAGNSFQGDLKSGSFIPNYTNSHWPSWGYLGSLVGPLPSDPINQWQGCPGADDYTCWNAQASAFMCPQVAQVYEYAYSTSTDNFVVHAPFEYFTENQVTNNFITKAPFISSTQWSNERWCEPNQNISALPGTCGDGVINSNEQCDPNGYAPVPLSCNSDQGIRVDTCNDDCKIVPGTCVAKATCGNGKIETGEICDDGADNGKYGKCDAPSTVSNVVGTPADESLGCRSVGLATGSGYCGNNKIDTTTDGKPYEYCEQVSDNQIALRSGDLSVRIKCDVNAGGLSNTLDQLSEACFSGDTTACVVTTILGIANFNPAAQCTQSLGRCSGDKNLLCNADSDCQNISNKSTSPLSLSSTALNSLVTSLVQNTNDYGTCQKSVSYGTNYNFYKNNSCSWDCQGTGGYCGDGITQYNEGEECDDKNDKNGDGCNILCQSENLQCIKDAFSITTSTYNLNPITKVKIQDSSGSEKQSCVAKTNGRQICAALGLSCFGVESVPDASVGAESLTIQDPGLCNTNIQTENITSFYESPGVANKQISIVCSGIANQATPQSSGQQNSCGDGIVSAGKDGTPNTGDEGEEACDLGTKNGLKCSPEYGKSCTYCSADCKNILTVDSLAYCGNNKIDEITPGVYEACDVKDGKIYSTNYDIYCDAQSNFKVGNHPALLGSCSLTNPTKNVELSCKDKGTVSCANNCTTISESCVNCGISPNGAVASFTFVNFMLGEGESQGQLLSNYTLYRKKTDGSADDKYSLVNYGDVKGPVQHLLFKKLDSSGNPTSEDLKIQSNAQCTNEYKMAFHYGGDEFDYPVNNEVTTIDNLYTVSPTPPPGWIRVVVRAPSSLSVVGNWLKNGTPYNYLSYSQTGSYKCKAIAVDTINHTVMPKNCNLFGSYFYLHPLMKIAEPYSTLFQAYSVKLDSLSSNLGFYVQSIDGSSIATYKNKEITVEIYENDPGMSDNVEYFYFRKPTHVFSIQAASKTSSNVNAKFWHVFNIKKKAGGGYEISSLENVSGGTKDGSIETCECHVKENIPGLGYYCTQNDLNACGQ